jgi:hypothetical protein
VAVRGGAENKPVTLDIRIEGRRNDERLLPGGGDPSLNFGIPIVFDKVDVRDGVLDIEVGSTSSLIVVGAIEIERQN